MPQLSQQSMTSALFYGSSTCYTEMAAEAIQKQWLELGFIATESELPLFNIKDHPLQQIEAYDFVILGISTWDFGEIQEDWVSRWNDIRSVDLVDKYVALYGMGDQYGYADWFVDALGMLHDEVLAQGATPIGYWPNEGYEFTASKALINDQVFAGLVLDDENQFELTSQRITQWCQQLGVELTDCQAG